MRDESGLVGRWFVVAVVGNKFSFHSRSRDLLKHHVFLFLGYVDGRLLSRDSI